MATPGRTIAAAGVKAYVQKAPEPSGVHPGGGYWCLPVIDRLSRRPGLLDRAHEQLRAGTREDRDDVLVRLWGAKSLPGL